MRLAPATSSIRPADLLHQARTYERSGCVTEAMEYYTAAIAEAERHSEWAVQSEALRRVAVLHHHRSEPEAARDAAQRSFDVASRAGDDVLAGEALNVLGGFDLEGGDLQAAALTFQRALALGGRSPELSARLEQNLGIVANVRGDLEAALVHYQRSLHAYQASGNEPGCAIAFHNLGMISADRGRWDDADRYFEQSLAIARATGDLRLQGLCLLNHAEVHVARQRFEQAMGGAESALAMFDQLGTLLDKADAYRVIGTVYRETGRSALAEARLKAAIDLSTRTNSVLSEAEASRELALLYQVMGRNQEALVLLNTAHGLFRRIDAQVELGDVTGRMARLEETYLALVRDWGQSIESSDSYTFGHCERVASYAVQLAAELGFDEHARTAIRVGAYLHDVGKIRVPHEILNKPGRLTPEEFDVIRMHPIWGIELLAAIEFPWDIRPIIRWHHEKQDGTGYPDRLRGEEIPVSAQIIGIVDVYDALTTTRSYRPAMTHNQAMTELSNCRHWWRPEVYLAFVRTIGTKQIASAA
ncbi:MAG TPA: HD domain-containing phosphohydrolase [Gemmatimonadales bacterium]|nr:HD domain-containing phosphohydrolase [Gemmatimonadales bacterium]